MEHTDSPFTAAAPETAGPALPVTRHTDADVPTEYDLADYRWVPVRRRARYDGWTEEKQRRFIEVLADTGLVNQAAKAVGMSRESAGRLRRSPHGAAFSRAWDAAREHAGSVLEDIAFERAIEGVEHNVINEYGDVVCTKRVYNDRLLTFLLGALKPERYGHEARARAAARGQSATPQDAAPAPATALDDSLRAMEPQLPAPPETLLDPETLSGELEIADVADGVLPHFLSEQRPGKSDARVQADAIAARIERGKAASEKSERKEGELSDEEFRDMCFYLDPTSSSDRGKRRFK